MSGLIALSIMPGIRLAENGQKRKETVETLDEVVVPTTKIPEKRKDVPNEGIGVDELQIHESPVKTPGELLANEPGIDWRTYGDYGGAVGEIHIRDMSGNVTQVRVKGLTVNWPSLGPDRHFLRLLMRPDSVFCQRAVHVSIALCLTWY